MVVRLWRAAVTMGLAVPAHADPYPAYLVSQLRQDPVYISSYSGAATPAEAPPARLTGPRLPRGRAPQQRRRRRVGRQPAVLLQPAVVLQPAARGGRTRDPLAGAGPAGSIPRGEPGVSFQGRGDIRGLPSCPSRRGSD